MITSALRHLPGLGPVKIERLQQEGLSDWNALLNQSRIPGLGEAATCKLKQALDECRQALESNNLAYFATVLHPQDRWRLLAHAHDTISCFDIETTGTQIYDKVTTIACAHKGDLHLYLRGENLDDFLDLLEDVDLLVSFNGATFDVPHILKAYNIPELPCPHLDLRWPCAHAGLKGGLKKVEIDLGLHRPADVEGVDGLEAVWLWQDWERHQDADARARLLRYCGADALSLRRVAAELLKRKGCPVTPPDAQELWPLLPPAPQGPRTIRTPATWPGQMSSYRLIQRNR